MLDHFTQYVGSSPMAAPAVLCGIAHMQTSEGVWYPRGGTHSVVEALITLAEKLGVEMRTNCRVKRILTSGTGIPACVGLQTELGDVVELAAIVSNADSVRTHRELLNDTAP